MWTGDNVTGVCGKCYRDSWTSNELACWDKHEKNSARVRTLIGCVVRYMLIITQSHEMYFLYSVVTLKANRLRQIHQLTLTNHSFEYFPSSKSRIQETFRACVQSLRQTCNSRLIFTSHTIQEYLLSHSWHLCLSAQSSFRSPVYQRSSG